MGFYLLGLILPNGQIHILKFLQEIVYIENYNMI